MLMKIFNLSCLASHPLLKIMDRLAIDCLCLCNFGFSVSDSVGRFAIVRLCLCNSGLSVRSPSNHFAIDRLCLGNPDLSFFHCGDFLVINSLAFSKAIIFLPQ